ncbi:kinesin-like protein KIF18A [Python bivittatus]|uniref:Kinesin-like protein KIF18A n=1 Tax=Python bivittatus TaxID=176946 RepID=A0A9F5IX01_PYTBI|nr:kinesin-like protein KIF18A [Python bivittatus]
MASPLTVQSPQRSSQSSSNHMVDSLSKAFHPIMYTPELCKKPVDPLCTETVIKQALHTTTLEEMKSHMIQIQEPLKQSSPKDVTYNVTPECHMSSTVLLFKNNIDSINYPFDACRSKSEAANSRSVLQRLGLPSLLNRQPGPIHAKPSYMAMTSAAARKRKLLSSVSSSGLTNQQDHVTAKRIRQDAVLSNKPQRVPTTSGIRTRTWKRNDGLRKHLKSNLKENASINTKLGPLEKA